MNPSPELLAEIASKKGGRPPGSTKDPDLEIIKEQNAWLARLRRSGQLVDQILASYAHDLSSAGLGRDAKMEIMASLKDAIAVQIKVISETQRIREKGGAGREPAGREELDLR